VTGAFQSALDRSVSNAVASISWCGLTYLKSSGWSGLAFAWLSFWLDTSEKPQRSLQSAQSRVVTRLVSG
jgi:hypothetical protein